MTPPSPWSRSPGSKYADRADRALTWREGADDVAADYAPIASATRALVASVTALR